MEGGSPVAAVSTLTHLKMVPALAPIYGVNCKGIRCGTFQRSAPGLHHAREREHGLGVGGERVELVDHRLDRLSTAAAGSARWASRKRE